MQNEKKQQSEDKIQSDCYVWFHNTYPQHRGLLCYNLNNSKNKIDGARNKAKGLQPGRSDFTFYYKGEAIFIEMKTNTGKQHTEQKDWERLVIEHGFKYYVCRSILEFMDIIHTFVPKCV